ncbi:MAG: 16S rRNA (cytosine(1402)-N(4))-methyltransferase RsmH [Kiritimatiellia bacterium]|nr:16S rRNA (cytosine(1402)-N(4))-methyltransferase RsmH [Kiritimatiellia bacterium]
MKLHVPVLLEEAIEGLAPEPGGKLIDATLGGGGHAEAILERIGPDGRLLGLDADPEAIRRCRERLARFGDRLQAVQARFSTMTVVAAGNHFGPVDGVLMDLGVSSYQVDEPGRGFSFRMDGPLDMRMNPADPISAAELVATISERDLADLLYRLGEEPAARRIARRIVAVRTATPLRTTSALAETVVAAGARSRPGIHPATRTFQALRMAVNRELEELESGLDQALGLLRPGGRLAVISFHSLEDRLVKLWIRDHVGRRESLPGGGERVTRRDPPVRALTRKPLRPGVDECERNPRARSARLRVAERMS